MDRLNFIQTKNIFSVKNLSKGDKRTIAECKKIFANNRSNKGLVSSIYKEL